MAEPRPEQAGPPLTSRYSGARILSRAAPSVCLSACNARRSMHAPTYIHAHTRPQRRTHMCEARGVNARHAMMITCIRHRKHEQRRRRPRQPSAPSYALSVRFCLALRGAIRTNASSRRHKDAETRPPHPTKHRANYAIICPMARAAATVTINHRYRGNHDMVVRSSRAGQM